MTELKKGFFFWRKQRLSAACIKKISYVVFWLRANCVIQVIIAHLTPSPIYIYNGYTSRFSKTAHTCDYGNKSSLGIVTLLTCFYRMELFWIAKRHHTSLSLVDAGSPHCRKPRILTQTSSGIERRDSSHM